MDKKKMSILIAGVSVVVIGLIALLVLFWGKEDSYRIIKVFELDGEAIVTRADEEITPYVNMILESGDNVSLDQGTMTLKMDEDKYAYVEEHTKFAIRAEGDRENSKTTITLIEGSITNEIQDKLSVDSTYEVNTPNATMAVRGTVFRVTTYYDEDGVCYTKVSVFEGAVSSRLVYPDKTVSDEEVTISAGKEVIIYEDEKTTDYLGEVQDIDYSSLPKNVVDLVNQILGTNYESTEDVDNMKNDTEETTTEENEDSHVVTFTYKGGTFATQQVKHGECASIPALMPSNTGDWDYDFTTPITDDTTIEWEE